MVRRFGNAAYNHSPLGGWSHAFSAWSLASPLRGLPRSVWLCPSGSLLCPAGNLKGFSCLWINLIVFFFMFGAISWLAMCSARKKYLLQCFASHFSKLFYLKIQLNFLWHLIFTKFPLRLMKTVSFSTYVVWWNIWILVKNGLFL